MDGSRESLLPQLIVLCQRRRNYRDWVLLSPTPSFPTVLVQLWPGEMLGVIVAPRDFGKNLKLRNGTTSHVELVHSLFKCFYSHLTYRLANFVARYEDLVTHRP